MTAAISPQMRRFLALTMLIVLIGGVWFLLVVPLVDMAREREADIAMATEQLEHMQALIARQPELERRAAESRQQFAASGGLWPGANTAVTAAAIQSRLREAVTDGGGRLRGAPAPIDVAEHGLRKVTMHFSVDGSLATIQRTLASIETATPPLFVETMTIAAPRFEVSPETEPVLVLELDVTLYAGMAPR